MKKLPSKCSSLLLHWTVAKIDQVENLPEMWKTVIFLSILCNKSTRNILNQNSKLVIELKNRKMIFRSEKDTSHSLQMKFWNFGNIYKKPPTYIIKNLKKEEILGKILWKWAMKMFRLKVSRFLNWISIGQLSWILLIFSWFLMLHLIVSE